MISLSVQELLNCVKKDYQDILGQQLTGIYLHGSLAFGCFNTLKSDLDFIVVVQSKLSLGAKLALLHVLEKYHTMAPQKGFEMSVVLVSDCQHFCYPTPYELHFSNMWREIYLKNPLSLCATESKRDPDLAGHFKVIKQCGIVLCGKPISEVFGEIPTHAYIQSIVNDITEAKAMIINRPTYTILNLCRVLGYLQSGKILSKEQGAEWALSALESQWGMVIRTALNNYRSSDSEVHYSYEDAVAFCDCLLKKIRKSLELRKK